MVNRIGKATMSKVLAETSEAIFQTLEDQFLKTASCQKEWLSISKGFEDKWSFPHYLRSLDAKHIRIEHLRYLTWANTRVAMTVVCLLIRQWER